MVSVDVCTEPDHHVLHDGWRSYPSGHSSFAFAGLGWLALLLASQTHVLRPRASLTVVLLSIAPLLVATLIAVSRLEDYRHDVFDVVSGAMLGFFSTYFNWRRYYPSLLSKDCAEPYPQLSSNAAGFQRVRDEEEASGPHMNERFTIGEE
jgi:diacylglycerol diphosphate phosphatase/phosphatidate phosphatase